MRLTSAAITVLFSLSLAAQAPAQPEAVRQAADGISADTLWKDLAFLASDGARAIHGAAVPVTGLS